MNHWPRAASWRSEPGPTAGHERRGELLPGEVDMAMLVQPLRSMERWNPTSGLARPSSGRGTAPHSVLDRSPA